MTPALRSSPRKERGDTRLLFRDTKVAIFQAMFKYETEGGDSPVGRLVKEFGVHRNTPRKILNKVVKLGTLDNTWHVRGRPAEFGEDVWDAMVEIVREYRERKMQRAPARTIRSELIARFDEETVPSIRTIQRKKAAKQYTLVKVEIKPCLSTEAMRTRYIYARVWTRSESWDRVVHI